MIVSVQPHKTVCAVGSDKRNVKPAVVVKVAESSLAVAHHIHQIRGGKGVFCESSVALVLQDHTSGKGGQVRP